MLENWNQQLFLWITAGDAAPPWAVQWATAVADQLIWGIPLLLAALWLWGDEGRRNTALQAVAVTYLALGFNQLIIIVWPHHRPFVDGLGHQWLEHAADPSFPSDHMTVFCGTALALLAGGARRAGALVLLCGVAVGWSRVYLGVHYPFDMLGALLVSVLAQALLEPFWQRGGARVLQWTQKAYRAAMAWPIGRGWIRR